MVLGFDLLGWKRPRHPTPSEMAVFRAFLPAGIDGRYESLAQQVTSAPYLSRRWLDARSYAIHVPFTYQHLLIPLYDDIESAQIIGKDRIRGERLSFNLLVRRGGVLGPLTVRFASPQRSRRRWELDESTSLEIRQGGPALPLPPVEVYQDAVKRVHEWLALTLAPYASEHCIGFPGAPEAALDAIEEDQGAALPRAYRDFLLASDGLDIGDLELLGSRDVTLIESQVGGNGKMWRIAELYGSVVHRGGASFDGVLAISAETNATQVIQMPVDDEPRAIAPDFRQLLSDLLKGENPLKLASRRRDPSNPTIVRAAAYG